MLRCVAVADPQRTAARAERLGALLHGLDQLPRSNRLPADLAQARITELVGALDASAGSR
jgi:hypothetical protein